MQSLQSILVYIDPHSDSGPLCIEKAMLIAGLTGAELTIAGVVPAWDEPPGVFQSEEGFKKLRKEIVDKTKDLLKPYKKHAEKEDIVTKIKVLTGPIVLALIDEILEAGHELLVKDETKEEEIREPLFGAVDQKLLRQCPASMLVVRRPSYTPREIILAATDADVEHPVSLSLNRELMSFARTLSRPGEFQLDVLHAWEFGGDALIQAHVDASHYAEWYQQKKQNADKRYRAFLKKFQLSYDSDDVYLQEGYPSTVIANHCNRSKIDTLVIGTVGRSGMDGFLLGNTAERVLRQISCSVLAVKLKGLESSVATLRNEKRR